MGRAPNAPERKRLVAATTNAFYDLVNTKLVPHLKTLRSSPNATPRQKVISEIMSGVDRTRIDTQRNLLDVLDKIHEISLDTVDDTHVFTLSQVYEGLLLKMGEKGNDGGQFFTPREIIRAVVEVVAPKPSPCKTPRSGCAADFCARRGVSEAHIGTKIRNERTTKALRKKIKQTPARFCMETAKVGETVCDPCCGTGGFLAQAHEFMRTRLGDNVTGGQIDALKHRTFYGREKENLVYPIALANLVLHGIDEPHIWHGNTLTREEIYSGLYQQAPGQFDVILTNPPFGGKEGQDAQTRFPYKTRATQVLFLQDVMETLKPGGRCGIVLDEGLLFQTNQAAFVQTKRRLLDTCNLWCIVSLPAGVFSATGAGVKTNLLFFTKGQPTKTIWYYDLSDVKVGKKTPFTRDKLAEFFKLLPSRGDSDRSWTVDIAERRRKAKHDADALRATANEPKARLKKDQGELDRLKSAKADAVQQDAVKERIKDAEREIREIDAKAQAIEDAAFDLKAINPNAKTDEDTRTPAQLLEFIAAKNEELRGILERLGAGMGQ